MARNFCVIIDPISTGAKYAPAFACYGIVSIAVRTSGYAADLAHLFKPDDFAAVIDFDGDLDSLVLRLSPYLERMRFVISGSHLGLKLADALANRLQTDFRNSTHASAARHDKYDLVERISQRGIAAPKQLLSGDFAEIAAWVRSEAGLPVVIKPRASAGSDLVMICRDMDALATGYLSIVGKLDRYKSLNGRALVQSYLSGTEYAVDSVSFDGHHKFLCLWRAQRDNGRSPFAYVQELIACESPEFGVATQYVASILDGCDYKFGPAHTEIVIDEEGVGRIIEMNARCHGTLDLSLPTLALGTNQVAETARAYCAGLIPPDWNRPPVRRGYALKVTLVSRVAGLIENDPSWHLFDQLSSIAGVYRRVGKGSTLQVTKDMPSSPGVIFLFNESNAALWDDYERLRELETEFYEGLEFTADSESAEICAAALSP